MMKQCNLENDLHKITSETLVITSKEDIIIPPIESHKMSEKILRAHVIEIAEGHASPIENPQELSKAIIKFLG
jgi:pimeloyl-ACP methyl ester carboxylesterase